MYNPQNRRKKIQNSVSVASCAWKRAFPGTFGFRNNPPYPEKSVHKRRSELWKIGPGRTIHMCIMFSLSAVPIPFDLRHPREAWADPPQGLQRCYNLGTFCRVKKRGRARRLQNVLPLQPPEATCVASQAAQQREFQKTVILSTRYTQRLTSTSCVSSP